LNEKQEHWERVHDSRAPDAVSWYRPHLERSLAYLEASGIGPDSEIIDVGGGASTLVDDLLDRGFRRLTVLDISPAALKRAAERLGSRAGLVRWVAGDVTTAELPEARYDFWHDRAVFHFLTEESARVRYVGAVRRSLRVGGRIVVATFGPSGPERCSGLDVVRYDAEALHGEFGGGFEKLETSSETHATPWGAEQEFVYCLCRMRGEPGDAPAAPEGRPL